MDRKLVHMAQSRYTAGGPHDRATGANIRAERSRRKLTQRGLAAAAGLSERTLVRIESGEVAVTLTHLVALGEALGIDPRTLFVEALPEDRQES